jgi:hypothetical protein
MYRKVAKIVHHPHLPLTQFSWMWVFSTLVQPIFRVSFFVVGDCPMHWECLLISLASTLDDEALLPQER